MIKICSLSLDKIIATVFFWSFAFLMAKSQPSWVTTKPTSPDYYIGIGYSNKQADYSHHDIARNMALGEIAKETQVQITSNSLLNVVETNREIKEKFVMNTRVASSAELKDYELVDTWENEQEYWVYYRLSKTKYQRYKLEKRNQALSIATDFFKKAKSYQRMGDPALAIEFYIRVLQSLRDYLNEPNRITYENREIYLANDAYKSLQDIMSSFRMDPISNKYKVTQFKEFDKSIGVAVRYKNSNTLQVNQVEGLKLLFSFTEGKGHLESNATTDSNGVASVTLSKVLSSKKTQTITARILLLDKQGKQKINPLVLSLLESLSRPQTSISLLVEPLSVYMLAEEKHNDQLIEKHRIEPKIKAFLSELGCIFVKNPDQADLIFDIQATSRKGSESMGLYSAYVTVIFTIKNTEGNVIYKASLNNIKGLQLDYDQAALKAFDFASDKLVRHLTKSVELFSFKNTH